MRRRNPALPYLAPLLFAAICQGASAQGAGPALKPLIRQVDHVLIETGDPAALFAFFADILQLPVAWPVADFSGFTSGGVGAGNVNIEVLRFAGPKGLLSGRRPRARFLGLALEPYRLADCLTELADRGIPHGPPQTYVSTLPDGSQGTLWTNVVLTRLSKPGLSVFLCEYSSAFLHAEIRRNQLAGQLALRNGGPLGVRSVKEIVIGTRDLAGDGADWRKLLPASGTSSGALLRSGNGPSIRLIAASADRIQRILLEVGSLRTASRFLSDRRLLGATSPDQIAIDPSKIQGLAIHLVER
ncbi:MAG: hypothetical protein HXY20_13310 [Acidobacteria bacterium]|nr:hypothetical protein [Acidobacteriota bacterium]